ncbi:hypothetical protein [Deinococcus sp.]|uniref:hypothetical protein n=1 Tax=Deinococcus sp. TaxID=47478 RepID=UPI003CC59CDC
MTMLARFLGTTAPLTTLARFLGTTAPLTTLARFLGRLDALQDACPLVGWPAKTEQIGIRNGDQTDAASFLRSHAQTQHLFLPLSVSLATKIAGIDRPKGSVQAP